MSNSRDDDYLHPLNTDIVRRIAREINVAVNDPDMASSTPTKVARAAADKRIPKEELACVLDRIIAGRKSGEILNPGGYFTSCAQRIFRKYGIPWRDDRKQG